MSLIDEIRDGVHDRDLGVLAVAIADRRGQLSHDLLKLLEPGDAGTVGRHAHSSALPTGARVEVRSCGRRYAMVRVTAGDRVGALFRVPPEIIEWDRWSYGEDEDPRASATAELLSEE